MIIPSHASQRLSQRGITISDIDLILDYGTETRDGYYLRERDVRKIETNLRKQINQLNKLAGKYVVVEGDTVITAYHPGKKKQKYILKK
jgi:hypothetical protein